MKKFYLPCNQSIELTGSVKPFYNGYKSKSYFKSTNKVHFGVDLVPGLYTSIGTNGKVIYSNPNNVGGGIVISYDLDNDLELWAMYWHGKPLYKKGEIIKDNTEYVTDSRRPAPMKFGKHTHFELRIVKKRTSFNYYKNRVLDVCCPYVLKPKNNLIKIGEKFKNNAEMWGFYYD